MTIEHWLSQHLRLSVAEATFLVAVLTLGVAAAFVRNVRVGTRLAGRAFLLAVGYTRRRYVRAFIARYTQIQNIYLNRVEKLDLTNTYVPLSFFSSESHHETRVPANTVLANPSCRRIIIVGDPGTGKSTLLKAYGAGVLKMGQRKCLAARDLGYGERRHKEVPFFVPLRELARFTDQPRSLTWFLVHRVLAGPVGGEERAAALLRRLLRQKRCVLLLDGLDEVTAEQYRMVRNSIIEFVSSDHNAYQTTTARVVISCRKQNFLRLGNDWIPTFAARTHILSPFNDAEIFRFLQRRRRDFIHDRTPEAFFASVHASGVMDLHRVPLILAISVGMYTRLDAYEIPSSLAKFYEEMINELLSRHDFRGDQGARINTFATEDKYRFLREFALEMASRPDRFDDFQYEEILSSAQRLAPRMAHLPENRVRAFIEEIIDQSGLLTRTTNEDEYVFAHRSIHEYLVAVQLSRWLPQGLEDLSGRSNDMEWRQIILFFASLDHEYVDKFLHILSSKNLELSGHCLAGALASDEIASYIIDSILERISLRTSLSTYLSALLHSTRAPRGPIRQKAFDAIRAALRDNAIMARLRELLAGDTEGLLRVATALAESNNPGVAILAVPLIDFAPRGDSRRIAPLWRCLATPGIEKYEECKGVIRSILDLVVDERCLDELQRQPEYSPDFATPEFRRRVYPFVDGHPFSSNLVTLIAWAVRLDVTPSEPNRYFTAYLRHPDQFSRLERDKRWSRSIQIHRPAEFICYFSLLGATVGVVAALCFDVSTRIGSEWLLVNWRTIALPVGIAYLAALVISKVPRLAGNERPFCYVSTDVNEVANVFMVPAIRLMRIPSHMRWVIVYRIYVVIYSFVFSCPSPLIYAIFLRVHIHSLTEYLVVASAAIWFLHWLPGTRCCNRNVRLYLREPNPCLDVYFEPRSAHWVQVLQSKA